MPDQSGPTLQEYVETRFNLLTEQLSNMGDRFDEKLREADVRYEQRFRAQMDATAKADAASEKRFEAVNEFRKTLTDQTATFVPRIEYMAGHRSLEDRVGKMEAVQTSREARISGAQETKTDSRSDNVAWISAAMMLIGIATLIISFLRKGP